MKPPFLPHLSLHRIKSHVIIITCLDFQGGSYPMMPCLSLHFPEALGQKESHTQLRQDASLLLTSSQKHTRMDMKDAFQRWIFLCRKVHFQKAKPKSLHLKSMLLKIMAFLSLFSFYKKKTMCR